MFFSEFSENAIIDRTRRVFRLLNSDSVGARFYPVYFPPVFPGYFRIILSPTPIYSLVGVLDLSFILGTLLAVTLEVHARLCSFRHRWNPTLPLLGVRIDRAILSRWAVRSP